MERFWRDSLHESRQDPWADLTGVEARTEPLIEAFMIETLTLLDLPPFDFSSDPSLVDFLSEPPTLVDVFSFSLSLFGVCARFLSFLSI